MHDAATTAPSATPPSPRLNSPPPLAALVAGVSLFPGLYLAVGLFVPMSWVAGLQVLFFLLPGLWLMRRHGAVDCLSRDGLARKTAIVVLATLALAIFLNTLLPYWEKIFPLPATLKKMYEEMLSRGRPYGLAYDILTLALIPALAEEVFFRGFLLTALAQRAKPGVAVVIAAAVFSAYHVNPWYLPFYFILGVWLGLVYLRSGNLGLAVLAHCVNNATSVVLSYSGKG